jgi:esterase/lipase superfamily enzyme
VDAAREPADWRIQRHQLFERFVMDELLPWIREDCRTPAFASRCRAAASGAFYAANFALKFPDAFPYALCMSGRYEMRHFTDGFQNGDVYFNNPLAYVAGMDGHALERVRQGTHLTLVCGQGAYEEGCIEETQALADLLAAKGSATRATSGAATSRTSGPGGAGRRAITSALVA